MNEKTLNKSTNISIHIKDKYLLHITTSKEFMTSCSSKLLKFSR